MLNRQKHRETDAAGGFKQYSGIAALLGIYVLFGFAQASNEYRVLFLENLGLTAKECGQILAAASLLSALSRPLAGALADKLRSRRVVYIGVLLFWGVVLALMLLTQNLRLAGFILCAGIVPLLSISEPVTYGMIEASGVNAALLNPKLDYSLIRVCLSVGYSVINFLYTPIVHRWGPTAPFFCTMFFVAGMLLLSGTLRKFETTSDEKRSQKASGKKLDFGGLFKNYFLVTFVLLNFIYAIGAHTQNFLFYLLKAVGLDGSLVGTATGIRVFGEIVIMPFIPLLKRRVSLPMLQAVACGVVVLQVTMYLTCHNPYVILGVTMLSGVASGITLSTTAVYLHMMAPEGLDTTTLSLVSVMTSLGAVITNLAGGIVVDTLGVFALYRISLGVLLLWIILYFGTWCFGTLILKKIPPSPMLIKRDIMPDI